ncbi:MAG TPA: TIGR03435 family protein [Bryobacteraceae bacterium]|nr:TIGR03435 family protein [Bryobacteraceae bacterium]
MKHPIAAFLLASALAYSQPQPKFEVASVKPSNSADRRPLVNVFNGSTWSNVTVKLLILQAYNIKDFQISGGPGWSDSDLFDVTVKPEGPMKPDQFALILQSLLADRFHLVIRRETREMPVYALVVAKNGPKIKAANKSDPVIPQLKDRKDLPSGGARRPGVSIIRRGRLTNYMTNMSALAANLANVLGRPVVDKTGLTGMYDLMLEWTPDENQVANFQAIGVPEGFGAPPPDWQGPTLFTALEEQLGLKLESEKGPVEMFQIERIERPSEN